MINLTVFSALLQLLGSSYLFSQYFELSKQYPWVIVAATLREKYEKIKNRISKSDN